MQSITKYLKQTFNIYTLIVLGLTITGFCLRFYNLNWDQNQFLHPDERNITSAIMALDHGLNPHFFAYGAFPMYFLKIIGTLLGNIQHRIFSYADYNYLSRVFSASVSTLTIPLIYLTTTTIFQRRAGLIAAFIATFTVGMVQYAHFGTFESLQMFLIVLILYFSFKIYQTNLVKYYLLSALFCGIAIATKVVGLSFMLMPLSAITILMFQNRHAVDTNHLKFSLCLFILPTFAIGFLFAPYNLLDWHSFIASMSYESGVVLNHFHVPYTWQFEHTLPYIYQLKQLFFWLFGIPLFISAILGIVYCWRRIIIIREYYLIIIFAWLIPYFIYIGYWYVKFGRYSLLMIPVLIIISAKFLDDGLHAKSKIISIIFKIWLDICFVYLLVWLIAFMNIYRQPDTRILASNWIYQHIPAGSTIINETWDDGLPLYFNPRQSPEKYQHQNVDMYSLDQKDKYDQFLSQLASADYITLSSRRVYSVLENLPANFPLASNYYQKLFSDQLGFQIITIYDKYPKIGSIQINDDHAEETFQVWDHSKVIIFHNVKHFTKDQLDALIKSSQ